MKQVVITKNDANQRIDNFLLKTYPLLTRNILYKAFKNKRIKVNKKRVDYDYRLNLNDVLELYINDEFLEKVRNNDFLKASDSLDVIYEDQNVIVVNKPIGLVVHEDDDKNNADTLINRIKKYLFLKKEYQPELENSFAPSLGHRLDRNTSGLIIAAKNFQSLQSLQDCFRNHEVNKNYYALVHGVLEFKNFETVKVYLEDESTGFVNISDAKEPNFKEAITSFKTVDIFKNKYTLLDVKLITGRKHQIRATLAYMGFPIVGEQKYTLKNIDRDSRFKYQCLVSYKLKFAIKDSNDVLYYLNQKTFALKLSNVWFVKKLNNF